MTFAATGQVQDHCTKPPKIVHKYLKFEICIAQARHKKYANRKRKPAYRFYIGQKVWLNSKNIKTARSQKKLD
jgi:hypothetical protein